MTLIAALSLLLITAHLMGRIAESLKQPALLGQMLAGVVLGPSLLNWVHATSALSGIVDLSMLFVVVTAGLEMRLQHVLDAFRGKGSIALLLGFLIPAVGAGAAVYFMHLSLLPAVVVTLSISITALPVALRILDSFSLLHTPIAKIAVSSALLSDVIVLLALAIAMTLATSNETTATTFLVTIGFATMKLGVLIAVVGVCHLCCLRIAARGLWTGSQRKTPTADAVLVTTLMFMLALGAISELLGFHFVIGVFLAALMVTRDLISDVHFESLESTCELMVVSLFGPLFLAYQGVQFKWQSLENGWFVSALLVVAIASKLFGGYAAARLSKLSTYDSLGVGIVMNARGVVGLVVASIAYRAGLINQMLFSTLLLVCIVTTVLTPLLLRQWSKSKPL